MKKKFFKAMLFILPLLIIIAIPFASAYEKGGGNKICPFGEILMLDIGDEKEPKNDN